MNNLPLLYLWRPLREKNIKELTTIIELFFEKIYPIFSNAEHDAEILQEKACNDFMEQPCYSEEEYIDPADVAETFIDFGIKQYEILSLMRYRTLAMWITCLCQAWEQQLVKFVLDEGKRSGIKILQII